MPINSNIKEPKTLFARPLDHLTEKRLEAPVVHVVFVNLLALVTPADEVLERAGKVYARASWHEGFQAQEDFNKQISEAG